MSSKAQKPTQQSKRYCSMCGHVLEKETDPQLRKTYPYVCPHCDENMFECETLSEKPKSPKIGSKAQKPTQQPNKLPKVGDRIETPRFLGVYIDEVFPTYEAMVAAGYREPTHYQGEFKVNGKSLDMYHMKFACSPLPPARSHAKKPAVKKNVVSKRYELVNMQGCVFDRKSFTSLTDAKEWAKDRGGTYFLDILDEYGRHIQRWKISNNRFYEVKDWY